MFQFQKNTVSSPDENFQGDKFDDGIETFLSQHADGSKSEKRSKKMKRDRQYSLDGGRLTHHKVRRKKKAKKKPNEERKRSKDKTKDVNRSPISRGSLPYNLPLKYALSYNKGGNVGIYNPEERQKVLKRYHDKRRSRNWAKKIRYSCRKNLAEKRHRVHGRFVKRGFVPPVVDEKGVEKTNSTILTVLREKTSEAE
eukprot:g90.t1